MYILIVYSCQFYSWPNGNPTWQTQFILDLFNRSHSPKNLVGKMWVAAWKWMVYPSIFLRTFQKWGVYRALRNTQVVSRSRSPLKQPASLRVEQRLIWHGSLGISKKPPKNWWSNPPKFVFQQHAWWFHHAVLLRQNRITGTFIGDLLNLNGFQQTVSSRFSVQWIQWWLETLLKVGTSKLGKLVFFFSTINAIKTYYTSEVWATTIGISVTRVGYIIRCRFSWSQE